MKIILILIVFSLVFALTSAQPLYDECLDNCVQDTHSTIPNNCCGCCNSTQTCNQIEEIAICCNAGQEFCGCSSSRADCGDNGFYLGPSSYPPFSTSSFYPSSYGTCYDSSLYSCGYNPGANAWILCPISSYPQPCINVNTESTCCEAASTCEYGVVSPSEISYCSGTCGSLNCPRGQGCCLDDVIGHQCYDITEYWCAYDLAAAGFNLCPMGLYGCAGACFNSTEYCCQSGELIQIQFCPN